MTARVNRPGTDRQLGLSDSLYRDSMAPVARVVQFVSVSVDQRACASCGGTPMDIRQQLQRLLDVADEARRHVTEIGAHQADAASELDAAEYDLRRLMEEFGSLLGEAKTPGVRRSFGRA